MGCELYLLLLALEPGGLHSSCAITWEGEPALLAALNAALERRGVDPTPGNERCVAERGTIEVKDDRLLLSLSDAQGRSTTRFVANATLAAALVESWTRTDLAADLLAEPTPAIVAVKPPEPTRTVIAAEPGSTPKLEPLSASTDALVVEDERALPLSIGVGPELGLSTDGALWLGAAASARTEVSGVEPAAALRFMYGRDRWQPQSSAASRVGLELMIGADLPLAVGPVVVRPGASIGAGWLSSARVIAELPPNCASCELDPIVPDALSRSSFGPRAEARLGAAWSMFTSIELELQLSATLAPLAHGDPIVPDYALGLFPTEREQLSISGEPLLVARAGLLVRWGRP